MTVNRPRKNVSVVTFHKCKGLTVRLEYDVIDSRQSVFLNDRLVSSFLCPVGRRAEHTFRSTDAKAEDSGHLGDYRIIFAVEDNTYQIRYEIHRKNASGDDTDWYWYDRNIEGNGWRRFPGIKDPDSSAITCPECGTECHVCAATYPEKCEECGEDLRCPSCYGGMCSQCGAGLSCTICDHNKSGLVEFNAEHISEAISDIDSEQLKEALISNISVVQNAVEPWQEFLCSVLNDCE